MYESIPRKIWKVIYPPLLLFGIYLLIYAGAWLIYDIFFSARIGDLDAFMTSVNDISSIAALTAGGVVLYLVWRRDFVITSDFLLKRPVYFAAVAGMGILAGHGLSILISLAQIDGIFGSYEQAAQAIYGSGAVVAVIKSVILAPLAEELAFRGLSFNRMKGYTNFWSAALVSSALFGLYHMNLAQGVYAFLYGILLCLVYEQFRNLWAPIAMHAAANAFSLLIAFAGLNYPTIPIFVTVMVVCLAGCAVIYFLVIRKVKAD